MLHIIDGYNLLFQLEFKSKSLAEARSYVIGYVQECFAGRKGVCIVFDGKQEKGLGFSRITQGSIEVIYTIDGMSADSYIIEWFQQKKVATTVCVYTHDLGLKRELVEYKAKVLDLSVIAPKKGPVSELERKKALSNPAYEKYLLETFTKKFKV